MVSLGQMGTVSVVTNVGEAVTRYPGNVENLFRYRYFRTNIRERNVLDFRRKMLDDLDVFLSISVKKIENQELVSSLRKWKESVLELRNNLENEESWVNYIDSYKNLIQVSNNILSSDLNSIQHEIERETIPSVDGIYLVQALKLVRDVFSFFYSFAEKAKRLDIQVSEERHEIFFELMETYNNFVYDIKEVIACMDKKTIMDDDLMESVLEDSSRLNSGLIRAKSIINVHFDKPVISKETEDVLNDCTAKL